MQRFVGMLLLCTLVIFSPSLTVNAQQATIAHCGDIIEGEFTQDQQPYIFDIELSAGDSIEVTGEPLGGTLRFLIALTAPNQNVVARSNYQPEPTPMLISDILSANGTYQIIVYNAQLVGDDAPNLTGSYPGGIGVYTIYIGCTLRDGTAIEPGDSSPTSSSTSIGGGSPGGDFPYGFPGVAPRDFSTGIEIPLQVGQPQTVPLASDVGIYTFVASTSESRVLTVSRLSGDISIGVTVIKRDTNEIIFLGGMPFSNNLSVELTFPSEGTYAIGLFRLDTAERTGTSGAVQIIIE